MNYDIVEEWGVMLLYMLCAGLAFRRFRQARPAEPPAAVESGASRFWLLLAIGLFLMGINKVADLQTPFIESLKSAAKIAQIDGYKPLLRVLLFAVLGGVGLAFSIVVFRKFASQLRSNIGLFFGLSCLGLFYLVRTTSIVGIAFKHNYWFNAWPLEVFSLLAIAVFTSKLRRSA
ncbi:MAG: hypothetical protein Aurels2KO_38100 [Aureliella sp.]